MSLLVLWSMAAVGGVVITGDLAGRALFLSQLPREAVALKFLLPPLALVLSMGVYGRVLDRFRRDRFVVGTSVLMAGVALLLWVLARSPIGGSLVFLSLLFAAIQVLGAIALIQFWTLAGDLFDSREARRLFGLISAGGTVAAVLFASVLGAAARQIPAQELLLVVAGALLICAACAAALGRSYGSLLERDPKESPEEQASTSMRALLRPRLVRAIAGIMLLAAVASAIADYQLDLALQARFQDDGAGMVTFLGVLRAVAGGLALSIQLLFAGRLFRRFGLKGGLLALPVLMAFGQGAVLLTGGALLATALPKVADGALKFDLNNTAVNLLLLPTSPRTRGRLKALLDGAIKPALLSGLGLVFLFVGLLPSVTAAHWAAVALLVVVGWLYFVRVAATEYVTALRGSLQQRRLEPAGQVLSLDDEDSLRVLRAALSDEDPAIIIQALALLEGTSDRRLRPHIVSLLAHSSEEVRFGAIELLDRTPSADDAEALRALVHGDPSPGVRGAALVALAAALGPEASEEVLLRLEDPAPAVRTAALRAALVHLGLEGVLHAGVALKQLFDAPEPRLREAGAKLLGDLGARSFYWPLLALLDDADESVRMAAIDAAEALGAPALIDPLIPRLLDPRSALPARRALASCLADNADLLDARLAAPETSPALRAALLDVAGSLGEAGHRAVQPWLLDPDARVRGAAARALRRAGGQPDVEKLDRALELELTTACGHAATLFALDVADDALTPSALRERLVQAGERALELAALAQGNLPVDSIRRSLRSRDRRQRANALELLETLLEPGRRELAVAVVGADEAALLERSSSGAEQAPTTLVELAGSDDRWLRACALFDLGRSGARDAADTARHAVVDPDPLVAETARQAAASLDPSDGAEAMAMTTLEKVLFLKSVPMLAALPGEAVAQIAPIAGEVRVDEGERFIQAGEEGHCLYVIVDGAVDVQGDAGTVTQVGSRAIIGELAVLTNRPRSADCVAASPLLMLQIGKQDFWALLEERPELSTAILREVVERYV